MQVNDILAPLIPNTTCNIHNTPVLENSYHHFRQKINSNASDKFQSSTRKLHIPPKNCNFPFLHSINATNNFVHPFPPRLTQSLCVHPRVYIKVWLSFRRFYDGHKETCLFRLCLWYMLAVRCVYHCFIGENQNCRFYGCVILKCRAGFYILMDRLSIL